MIGEPHRKLRYTGVAFFFTLRGGLLASYEGHTHRKTTHGHMQSREASIMNNKLCLNLLLSFCIVMVWSVGQASMCSNRFSLRPILRLHKRLKRLSHDPLFKTYTSYRVFH